MLDTILHYDTFLARCYTWMQGGFDNKARENQAIFDRFGVRALRSMRAVDLGCGPGYQAIPLARCGFCVTAIDLCGRLLAELESQRHDLPIKTVRSDMRLFAQHCPDPVELIVCMGDTLTHLSSLEEVSTLLQHMHTCLEPEGRVLLTFRDLSVPRSGVERFLPVRSDASRIFTCFLEYQSDHVVVHDLLHESECGTWNLHKSAYKKLRISTEWCKEQFKLLGFALDAFEVDPHGLATIVAHKPSL